MQSNDTYGYSSLNQVTERELPRGSSIRDRGILPSYPKGRSDGVGAESRAASLDPFYLKADTRTEPVTREVGAGRKFQNAYPTSRSHVAPRPPGRYHLTPLTCEFIL